MPVNEPPPLPLAPPRPAWDLEVAPGTPTLAARYRVAISVGSVVLALLGAALVWWLLVHQHGSAPVKRENMVVVNVPPPPPPPPLPPPPLTPPPPQPEEKMIDQTPVENETKPEPKADEPPPADLGGAVAGNGPGDAFGLSSGRGSALTSGRGNANAAARSRWGWYASQVQSRIQQAVRGNKVTRSANLHADVKIWADASGRITKATLAAGTGDATLDSALREQVLTGLQLSEAPPEGMPMPIVLRITARRP
jgi:outer membrane biosynthesis protein TonB